MASQLTIGIVIAAALADSINPCVFGVLIFLMGYMLTAFKSKARLLVGGLIYIATVYVTYFLIGLGILSAAYSANLTNTLYTIAAVIAIFAGILEVKDFFWYGKGPSLQIIPGGAERIKKYTYKFSEFNNKHPAFNMALAVGLGVLVVFVELPCTGAPYLAIIGLLAAGEYSNGVPLLLFYNLIFILPLLVILGLVYTGKASKQLEAWRKKHRGLMRLFIGIFLLTLGTYMFWLVS
ncbi:MAG: hypothetical protein QF775_04220 [archaeon]|jgi:cytochrome c biogenesis protein CcdA|nr:hypothetical protein [Euryarchaeota archaeon]MDP6704663.1 hypothetical protein [archaeon]|tara:strand:+ start:11862 stop:12569 length:708 start_codon:yes stop_codon:yes gene_type:complete